MIRKAVGNDLPEILKIYENARRFMAENGNPNQWGKTNPPQYTLERDIQLGQLYVVVREGKIRGVLSKMSGKACPYGHAFLFALLEVLSSKAPLCKGGWIFA